MFTTLIEQLHREGMVSFTIRAHPGAKKTASRSVMSDGSFKIDLAAPPEEGKANDALVRFLSKEFQVSRKQIEIVSGHTSRKKVVRITV